MAAQRKRLFPVPFYPGNGDIFPGGRVFLYVSDIAEFPRDMNGYCAFCHSDPCADRSPEDSYIWRYMNTPMFPNIPGFPLPQVCPLCDGKAP